MATRKSKTSPRSMTADGRAATKSRSRSAPSAAAKRPSSGAGDPDAAAASALVDQRLRDIGGWRGETLAHMRAMILEADPDIAESLKWKGTPVWSRHGIVCTGEAYANVVKLTFARGAAIPDPAHLFNAGLAGGTRRAIDIREGETLDPKAFNRLVKAAVALNAASSKKTAADKGATGAVGAARKPGASGTLGPSAAPRPVRLLSGGNPQIARGHGDAPVQAYIDAMPGWKRDVGRRLDALIARTVPGVRKAVKWNSPLYGVDGESWFLSVHCFTKYIKIAFFRGASLRPPPPIQSKVEGTRYLHIHEHDDLDEPQLAAWVKQASRLPGERM